MQNRIVKVELILNTDTGLWSVHVTKEFAPEHGGGTQVFVENGGRSPHYALFIARGMVTVSAEQRTDIDTVVASEV